MKKSEVLERVRAAHERLARALEGLSEEEATRTGVTAQWSVRDALGHVVAWEFKGAEVLGELIRGNSVPNIDDEMIERFNAEKAAERRTRSLAEVKAEAEESHRRLIETLEQLPEELDESTRLYRFTEVATFGHITHHTEQIENWRRSNVNREA
jgi:hypothetical protein